LSSTRREPPTATALNTTIPTITAIHPARAQAALLDSLFGTERGLSARSEVRAEINELITQLEAKNPTPSPTEVRAGCVCVCVGAIY
jgi:hypothetical protein